MESDCADLSAFGNYQIKYEQKVHCHCELPANKICISKGTHLAPPTKTTTNYTNTNTSMDDIEKRRLELDRKRQKLEDMRKARKERTLASTSESLSVETSQKPLNLLNLQLQKKNAHKEDVASLVASLIGSPLAATSSTSTTTLTPQAPTASTLPFTSLHAPYGSESTTPGTSTSASARPLPHLSLADFIIFDVAPKDRVLYSKQVQTTATQSPTTVDLAAPSLDTQAQTRDSSSTTPVVSLAQSPVLQLDRGKI